MQVPCGARVNRRRNVSKYAGSSFPLQNLANRASLLYFWVSSCLQKTFLQTDVGACIAPNVSDFVLKFVSVKILSMSNKANRLNSSLPGSGV